MAASVDPKTNKMPDEDLTSTHAPEAPKRDKSPERNYPEFERRDPGVNPKGAGAPRGPVNIGVKQPEGPDRGDAGPPPGATEHRPVGKQGSSSMPEE
jgi:hypothetical protein